MTFVAVKTSLFDRRAVAEALLPSLMRLSPRYQLRNPVMFVVWVGAVLTTLTLVVEPGWFVAQITFWLWFTLLFANFAEALAEGKGKAQAETLKKSRRDVQAKLLTDRTKRDVFQMGSGE